MADGAEQKGCCKHSDEVDKHYEVVRVVPMRDVFVASQRALRSVPASFRTPYSCSVG